MKIAGLINKDALKGSHIIPTFVKLSKQLENNFI